MKFATPYYRVNAKSQIQEKPDIVRVLMFGWELPPSNSGGLGVACEGLARALVANRAEITFVLPRKTKLETKGLDVVFADTTNIDVKIVNSLLMPYMTSREYTQLHKYSVGDVYGNTLMEEVMRYARKASEIVKTTSFDIIHAHEWLAFPAGLVAKKLSGKPLVLHVHATEFDRSGFRGVNPQVYAIEKDAFEQADTVIAVSNYTKGIICQHYGISPEKVHVVHNGVKAEPNPVSPTVRKTLLQIKKEGDKLVLFVGRLTLHKGPDYFLQAAKQVLEHYPHVVFVLAGSGELEHQLIDQVAAMGIADRVVFTGFLRGRELKQMYKAADLCVFPSISEPFGLTTLESLANGTPVLVSKQSGVSEILSHTLKADFWDVQDITDKILAVLQYGSLIDTLSEHGTREAQKITWEKAAQKCINIYKKVASHLHL